MDTKYSPTNPIQFEGVENTTVSKQMMRLPKLMNLGIIGFLTFAAGLVIAGSGGQPIAVISGLFLLLMALVIGSSLPFSLQPVDRSTAAAQAIHQRARAIYEVANALGAALDYNKVLDAALDVGVLGLKDMAPKSRLVGMVMLIQNDVLHVVTSRRLTRQDEKVIVPGQEGVLGQAFRRAEPVFGTDAHSDPELSYFAAFQDARSVLVIPLRAGFDNYGVLVFGSTEPDAFDAEQTELFTAIGSQATIALQNAVLYQNLRKEKERIVEVEEDARKKLARDLHDGPTQSVSAIAMRVNLIQRMLEQRVDVREELAKVEEIARQTTKEIRNMLFTLRPLALETQGLSVALLQFSQKMKETHSLDVILQAQQGVDELVDNHVQGVLFYIVEEAVNNARKHAKAAHIYMRLYRRDRHFVVEIQDDGVGFDLASVDANYDQRGSLGMVNMRERAALADGILNIESAKGKGTKISVLVPLKELAARPSRPNLNGAAPSRTTPVASKIGPGGR